MMSMNKKRISHCQRMILITVACLMVLGTGWTISATEDSPAAARDRGGDVEPNDVNNASQIADGEVVEGSLRTDPADDRYDYYKVETAVPYGKILCATLFIVDHNPVFPNRTDLNIIAYYSSYGYMYPIDNISSPRSQTETLVFLQNWNKEPETIWLYVYVNFSGNLTLETDPCRYQLTVTMPDISKLSGAPVTGDVEATAGPKKAYYEIAGPANDTGIRLRLQSPPGTSFVIVAQNEWPVTGEWQIQNFSFTNSTTGYGELCVVGIGGQYHIIVMAYSGGGTYTLTLDYYGGPIDGDNFPRNATLVTKNSINYASLTAGLDSVDWWKVNMKMGVPLNDVIITLVENEFTGYCNISAFNESLSYINGEWLAGGSGSFSFGPLSTDYNGPLYFVVRTYPYFSGRVFYPSWGDYKLAFRFPNAPPRLDSNIPPVVMDEDTTDNSTVLSDYVTDPDGDDLNFTLACSNYRTQPVVDRHTGRVGLAPLPDWWGQETIRLQAQDDGPYQNILGINLTVIVNPVNDAPVALQAPDVVIPEGTTWTSPDLATLFYDNDNGSGDMCFCCRVLSSDTHPPGAQLPLKMDGAKRVITAGPAPLVFGNFTIQLNCSDGDNDTAPALTRFNISISHVNHAPEPNASLSDPLQVTTKESEAGFRFPLGGLFTDPDLPVDYAADHLTYSVTGMKKLGANIDFMDMLVLDARNVEARPGFPDMETLTVTATDRAGATAMLGITVTIEPENDPPAITAYQPVDDILTLKEGQKKTFSVTALDVDTDGKDLTYAWYLDGARDPRAKGASYTLETDVSMGGAVHRVRVEVSDGKTNISREWEVTVPHVNRSPEGSIKSPLNLSSFTRGTPVVFSAEGSDPDGDNLTFVWRDLAGNELGRGATFTTKTLLKGSQTIRLEINDTKGSTYRDVTILIKEIAPEPKKSPGFGAAALIGGAGASGLIAAIRRADKRSSDENSRGRRLKRGRGRTGSAILSIVVTCILLAGSVTVGSAAGQHQAAREGRGGDIEPNTNKSQASHIAGGEVVNGSLLIDPPDDYNDWYVLDGGLEAGKLMCVTLYLVDYDTNDPGRYNFNMTVYESTHVIDNTQTLNQTETFTYFRNPDNTTLTIYIYIAANCSHNFTNITTPPGRYQLSVTTYDPPVFNGIEATGYLHTVNGPGLAVYRFAGPAMDAGMRIRIDFPRPNIFYLGVYNVWPLMDQWWCQNMSYVETVDGFQSVGIVGVGGPYYIIITAHQGMGTYTLSQRSSGGGDTDNSPANATLVKDITAQPGFVASGVDAVDWWKVNVRADVPVVQVHVRLINDQFTGAFTFAVFDQKVRLLTLGTMDDNPRYVIFDYLTVSYNGPLYFAVIAGTGGYDIAMGCYTLQFMLPNDPPRLNDSLPPMVMDEDTSYDGLVLSDHVIDVEGDLLQYSLVGSNYNTTPKVDGKTGRINFTPKHDWSGQEVARFMVKDDGPVPKVLYVNVSVTVRPVNDPPVAVSYMTDTSVKEEAEWQTPDLYTMFKDIDDEPCHLSFGCRVVSSDTHPPGALLPIRRACGEPFFTLGPVRLAFGTFMIELNCTDDHPGTVVAATSFNLTIGQVNHDPRLKENVNNPLGVTIKEHDANYQLALDELFTDPDLPASYAGDRLTYSVAGAKRLAAKVNSSSNMLVIDTSMVEYRPGSPDWETLTVTAKDKAGRTATLNISMTIEPVNDPPAITEFGPEDALTTVKEGQRKVFSVAAADADTDDHDLTYSWFLDDALKAHGKNNSFSFEPDYSMGGATHRIRAEVSDGNTTVSKEWQVLVAEVNRLPDGSIRSPASLAKFVKGAAVTFTAEGSDPDGDNLTFVWRDSAGTVLGRGTSFTTKGLKKGTQTITLEINDSKGGVIREVPVTVTDAPAQKKSPGFEAVPFLAALCLAAALGAFLSRERRDK